MLFVLVGVDEDHLEALLDGVVAYLFMVINILSLFENLLTIVSFSQLLKVKHHVCVEQIVALLALPVWHLCIDV